MTSFKLLLVLLFISTVCGEDEEVESLCENPVIHAADRMLNETVRVYRDYHYWELVGLPDRRATTLGPFRIWWPDFAPVLKNMTTVTVLEGVVVNKGTTYKFHGPKFWSWYGNGSKRNTNPGGQPKRVLPLYGFDTAYHDANLSGLGYPILVGLRQIKIWYYNTSNEHWEESPKSENKSGFLNGKFNEHFPGDITSSFMWPSVDPKVKYYVYLFKGDEHCFRSWQSNDANECEEWRKNRELFGCTDSVSNQPQTGKPNESQSVFSKSEISSLIVLAAFCFKIYL